MSETEKAEKGAMGDDEEGEVLTDPKISFACTNCFLMKIMWVEHSFFIKRISENVTH